ncbi:SDR family oxidoreductase [Agrilutibacter solisilvae]|uniref:SDR family oxidoreductase n=1 Tax=Agrilutibacter solisilvae TaxID=2763317 RepID=A0A975ATF7_9GAMM|nr:SDR family oxidoreductase [Lysobacter solisilvae]QSX79059.1 SDR family oxidoreductase [Lysobacter solisilvae]
MPTRSVVTGANRGLGLEFVHQLLGRGDHVIAACRHPGKATDLNRLAGEHPGRLHVLPLDVADERSRTAFAHELPLVVDGIDLLVNNAGVLHSGERWGHVSAAILEDSLRVNAMGPFLLTQALDAQLADGATVATVSSMMSSLGDDPSFNAPSYRISKTALNMATKMLASALAPRGITVVALCPGWVQTEMGGEGAQITPAQSVSGLLRTLGRLKPADTGKFLDWQGKPGRW